MDDRPDFNRIRKAAALQEPDRVPLCEVLIEYPIQSQFLGRPVTPDDLASQVEFWSTAGYDYIPLTVGMMNPGKVTQESRISRVIRDVMLADIPGTDLDDAWNLETHHFIRSRTDFERFPWTTAGELDFSSLQQVGGLLPEGMKAIAVSGKIFTLTWMLMGFNDFAMKLILEEDLVADVFKRVAQIQLRALEAVLDMPHVGAVWVVDDLAFGTGPMISPQAFPGPCLSLVQGDGPAVPCERLAFFSSLRWEPDRSDGRFDRYRRGCSPAGGSVMHGHRDGHGPVMAIVSAWPGTYPMNCCAARMLRTSKPVSTHCFGMLPPGGGYCLGSGNSVPAWAKFENYMVMRETALENGRYPIDLD